MTQKWFLVLLSVFILNFLHCTLPQRNKTWYEFMTRLHPTIPWIQWWNESNDWMTQSIRACRCRVSQPTCFDGMIYASNDGNDANSNDLNVGNYMISAWWSFWMVPYTTVFLLFIFPHSIDLFSCVVSTAAYIWMLRSRSPLLIR